MRRIKIIEHISLDGVIQAPGGTNEDGDYSYGGWIVPFMDAAVREAITEAHGSKLDLLLGRRTYDIWSGYWPKVQSNPIGELFRSATKYVVTHRPESLEWGPVDALSGDFTERLRQIKATDGADIIVWGSSTITPKLLESGLVDEVLLLVYPVLLGLGKRFFSADASARELALVSSKVAASGVMINTYRPVGPLKTGSFLSPPR